MNRSMPRWACLTLLSLNATAVADIREFEVTFESGKVQLAGTVVAPGGEGPYPGIVMVGGSGASDRSRLMEIAGGFALGGLAVLAYDKRGTGKSGGNWTTSSLHDLADDAAAAFRALAAQPMVDPARTGYWGTSQGGWVVPIAAGHTPAAFVIIVSGGGLCPREIESLHYLAIVEGMEGGPQAVREARQLLDSYFSYLAGEQPRDPLMRLVEDYRDRPWLAATGIENVIPSESNRENWAWVADFEPAASIAAMTMPVLVLLGGADPLTPAERTAGAWRQALADAKPESQVEIVPDAGHGLRTGAHGGPLVPGFFSRQLRWLEENLILPPSSQVLLDR